MSMFHLSAFAALAVAAVCLVRQLPVPALVRRLSGQRGQATAEYALVLLGAAAIALMLTAWAAKSGAIGKLFDAVVGQLIRKVG